jgi:hypothetical protein
MDIVWCSSHGSVRIEIQEEREKNLEEEKRSDVYW